MKFELKIKLAILVLFGTLGMVACGGGTTSSKTTTPPPQLGSMAGAWDFTVSGGSGSHPIAIEAVLTQDNSGNISSNGTATANGPSGNFFEADILGSSLSTATDVAVDYLGDTCGADTGTRSITGTINSSSQVTISTSNGGSFSTTITGSLNSSANPPFTGSGTVNAPGCKSNGQAFTMTGVLASSLTGTFSGTSAANNSEAITLTVTDTSGALTGNGTDSVSGNFTMTGTTVGNAFSTTLTPAPAGGGSIFGYFDPQLGAKGSILLINFQSGNAVNCPSGVPIDNGSCLIAVLAMQ